MNQIIIVLLTLLGFNFINPKNDLRKRQTRVDFKRELNLWIEMNFGYIALAVMIIITISFIGVCFFICGVSATESGMLRNFINGGMV